MTEFLRVGYMICFKLFLCGFAQLENKKILTAFLQHENQTTSLTFKTLNEGQQLMITLRSPSLFISQYLERFTLYNRCSYSQSSKNHKLVKKQRWRIRDASLSFPSSLNENYERSKAICCDILPHATRNVKFMDVSEFKREFDKYLQVKLLILAEWVLVMADPLQKGHGVKTQHWNGDLISSSSDPSQTSQITRLDRSQWQLTPYV